MDIVTFFIILFLGLYLILLFSVKNCPCIEGFEDGSSGQMGFLMVAPTILPNNVDAIGILPTLTVKNHAKINAKYEYDEKFDESRINFNVKIPQGLSTTYDLNDEQIASYTPYQMRGFCNALNSTSDTIEEKCNQLDPMTCANTTCCVLYGGEKCVAGDERGPTFQKTSYQDTKIENPNKYYYMGNCYGNCSNYIANQFERRDTPSKVDVNMPKSSSNEEYKKTFFNFDEIQNKNKPTSNTTRSSTSTQQATQTATQQATQTSTQQATQTSTQQATQTYTQQATQTYTQQATQGATQKAT